MTRRDIDIGNARIAGYHDDRSRFTRLVVESRVRRAVLDEAWREGRRQREAGMRCGCYYCERERRRGMSEYRYGPVWDEYDAIANVVERLHGTGDIEDVFDDLADAAPTLAWLAERVELTDVHAARFRRLLAQAERLNRLRADELEALNGGATWKDGRTAPDA